MTYKIHVSIGNYYDAPIIEVSNVFIQRFEKGFLYLETMEKIYYINQDIITWFEVE